MTVYLVEAGTFYEGGSVLGVYAKRDSAIARAQAAMAEDEGNWTEDREMQWRLGHDRWLEVREVEVEP